MIRLYHRRSLPISDSIALHDHRERSSEISSITYQRISSLRFALSRCGHYARIDFQCGDWRWGNMKVRCPRQHRLGETCGAKLSDMESITRMGDDCRICQHISVKQRRLQRVTDNLIRWRQEGDKFSATIEKARREAADLVTTIHKLHKKRTSFALRRKDEAEKV